MSTDAIKKLNDIRQARSLGYRMAQSGYNTGRPQTKSQKEDSRNYFKSQTEKVGDYISKLSASKQGEYYKPQKLGGKTLRRKGKKSRKTQKRR